MRPFQDAVATTRPVAGSTIVTLGKVEEPFPARMCASRALATAALASAKVSTPTRSRERPNRTP
jgi:hypothetical protein